MAAVTFSGFNNVDFNHVVNAIIAQERQPLVRLETQQSALERQKSLFGTLAGRLTALQSAIEVLSRESAVTGLAATSSDASVGVSTSGSAVEGSYDLVVNAVARRQVTASVTTYGSADEIVATGGALTLTGADGTVATIPVDAIMTVKDLVDAINRADAPVTASLVQSAPGSYQIVLTGRHTGTGHSFTIGSALAGGTGLQFADGDGNGVSGDSPEDNVQNAVDAQFTVNGLAITSASNTVSDVIPGVTVTLTKEDPATTVTITTARDLGASKDRVNQLIKAYNDLVGFVEEQRTAAVAGQASIAHDPLVQQLRNSLRSTFLGAHQNDGGFARLAEVGIGFDRSGRMTLDEGTFEKAVTSQLADVTALFSGSGGSRGAFGTVGDLIKTYTQTGGLVADVRQRLTTQVKSLTDRLDALEAQLERRRLTLQREFQAADEAMAQLNAQVSSLSSLAGQFRLF